ncbi:MAG: hypothetical protein GY754_19060 [bacterium]|nr:hypothetical protein [bacterium]
MEEQKQFRKIGYIGIGVILLSLIMGMIFPTEVPALMKGFMTPIVAFEFVETKEDVYLVFGENDTPERRILARSMDLGNYVDYIYMFFYSSFLFFFSMLCARITGKKIFYAGAAMALFILAGDFMENIQLLGITAKLTTGDFGSELFYLKIFTWQKWGLLAIVFFLLSFYLFKGNRFFKIGGIFGILPIFLAVPAFFHRSVLNELLFISTAIFIFFLIVHCFLYKAPESA